MNSFFDTRRYWQISVFYFKSSILFIIDIDFLLTCCKLSKFWLSLFIFQAIDDIAFVLTFLCFLMLSLLQIFFLCFFGDLLMESVNVCHYFSGILFVRFYFLSLDLSLDLSFLCTVCIYIVFFTCVLLSANNKPMWLKWLNCCKCNSLFSSFAFFLISILFFITLTL